MFISDQIVFLELQKTGCSHIRKLLDTLLVGEIRGKHNYATDDLFSPSKFFLGSIRNPWEWYISLWAYGCDQKGALFERLTKKIKLQIKEVPQKQIPVATFKAIQSIYKQNFKRWEKTYQDVNNASAFRDWLCMMFDSEYVYDVGEGFASFPLSQFSGLLTYRYLKLFTCKKGTFNQLQTISSFPHLKSFEQANCFIDHFIANENLEKDLLRVLKSCGIEISEEQEQLVRHKPKTNTSSRKKKSNYYYDEYTKNLVLEREKLIIDKFGYVPPQI